MLKSVIFIVVLLLISITFLFQSCTREPVLLYEYDTICFQEDVLPLLQTSCGTSGCHDSKTATKGFNATSYQSIKKMVVAGDARSSKLYQVITAVNNQVMMPPDGALNYQQRTLIRIWIEQGAMNTICDPVPVDTADIPVDTIPEPVDTTPPPPPPPPPPCFEDSVSFSNDVWPIINKSCVGCHNSSRARGGRNLDSYSNVVSVASAQQNGTSLLYGVIERLPGFTPMPQSSGKLDTCSVNIVKAWIDEGMKNN